MAMTIAVYRVNPETGERTQVREKHTVKPLEVPEATSVLPPCSCPRCVGYAIRLHAKVREANRRSQGRTVTGTTTADTSTMSAECGVAQRPEYKGLHRDCRRTKGIPLPGGAGLMLIARCTCPCHPYNQA
ncbi:hypothetical protein [Streptomyces sp. NPDC021356]|uniref:hypothetical protein n=1 Tax=Streptomyces sp. NPDC021356 TaxID=3154900 RepID=UPI0033D946D7